MKKILVVDDEKPLAKALALKLGHEGFEVETASNGEDALTLLEQKKPDLVLLDLVMPKLDGFGVLEAMKSKKQMPPVIILSNLSQSEDEKKARQLGAVGFFIKSDTELSLIIKEVKKLLK